ncbi:DNA cytosine methyltransferase [Campylobacter suis]|uniref:Cytosine-specific methyltransferase n=1 Tax=Campylobacter suis TaxID=2790657 RepID=A0ABM8Q5V0_9BACT|nr:DNA cytosine methyltransferase [Campylobacter suis]CAD7288269.1 IS1595 family transposase ISCco3 [Campylobacter suis]
MKIASFFAGVGGIEKGFNESVVYANEIDANACITYQTNEKTIVDNKDIRLVNENTLPKFDTLVAGFPCQAFSVAGYQKGFNDERGNIFFDLLRIIKANQPSVIFLENVKNLVSHDMGNTFAIILSELENLGYFIKYQVLNACEYGNTPQNRERIYIVGFKDETVYRNFDFPKPVPLTRTIADIVDFNAKVDERYYYTPKSAFYDELKKSITKSNTIYQWRRRYVRENKSNVCPTLTANMGTGGHNVPLVLTKHGIRKLTPKECFMFQGFGSNFVLPEIANMHLYKQAGNSVCVKVIKRIADNIKVALG